MAKRVEILKREEVFRKAIFRLQEVRLRHELYAGGMSDEIVRLSLERGDSVSAVVHDTVDDLVVFTEQFRYPTFEKGPGWILELPAGMLDAGDATPTASIEREILEETGYAASGGEHVATFYVSPGGTSERIHLYYFAVQPADRRTEGGGKHSEGEDIRTVTLPVSEALARAADGRIEDAKTLIGLQWLALRLAGGGMR